MGTEPSVAALKHLSKLTVSGGARLEALNRGGWGGDVTMPCLGTRGGTWGPGESSVPQPLLLRNSGSTPALASPGLQRGSGGGAGQPPVSPSRWGGGWVV